MTKSIRDIAKKKETRGRKKTTGPGEPVLLRLHPPLTNAIDEWAKQQDDNPSRPEAIRRLVERALAGVLKELPPSKATARKASELASREIDRLGDKSATGEERASRKRRLIAGPKEFRGIRRK
jgi:hypothetical protein